MKSSGVRRDVGIPVADASVVHVTTSLGSPLVAFEPGELTRDMIGSWLWAAGIWRRGVRIMGVIEPADGAPLVVAAVDLVPDQNRVRATAILAPDNPDADPITLARTQANGGDPAPSAVGNLSAPGGAWGTPGAISVVGEQ